MKKKIITAIAILMGLHVVSLAILTTVFPPESLSTDGIEPKVEYFEAHTGGGFSGGFQSQFKAYRDGSGYHIFFKNSKGDSKTYDLTKSEYILCASPRKEDLQKMADFEGVKGADLFYTSVKVKYQGETELVIPGKSYDLSSYGSLLKNLSTIVRVKEQHLEKDPSLDISKRLCSYALSHKQDFLTVTYSRTDNENTSEDDFSISFYAGVWDRYSKDLVEYIRLCQRNAQYYAEESSQKFSISRDFFNEDSKIVNYNGHRSFFKMKTEEDMAAFCIFSPDTGEVIYSLSTMPAGYTQERYEQDITAIAGGKIVSSKLDTAVTIEVISFFALTAITVLTIYLTGRKKKDQTAEQ